jgi:hypothetical protein
VFDHVSGGLKVLENTTLGSSAIRQEVAALRQVMMELRPPGLGRVGAGGG